MPKTKNKDMPSKFQNLWDDLLQRRQRKTGIEERWNVFKIIVLSTLRTHVDLQEYLIEMGNRRIGGQKGKSSRRVNVKNI